MQSTRKREAPQLAPGRGRGRRAPGRARRPAAHPLHRDEQPLQLSLPDLPADLFRQPGRRARLEPRGIPAHRRLGAGPGARRAARDRRAAAESPPASDDPPVTATMLIRAGGTVRAEDGGRENGRQCATRGGSNGDEWPARSVADSANRYRATRRDTMTPWPRVHRERIMSATRVHGGGNSAAQRELGMDSAGSLQSATDMAERAWCWGMLGIGGLISSNVRPAPPLGTAHTAKVTANGLIGGDSERQCLACGDTKRQCCLTVYLRAVLRAR